MIQRDKSPVQEEYGVKIVIFKTLRGKASKKRGKNHSGWGKEFWTLLRGP